MYKFRGIGTKQQSKVQTNRSEMKPGLGFHTERTEVQTGGGSLTRPDGSRGEKPDPPAESDETEDPPLVSSGPEGLLSDGSDRMFLNLSVGGAPDSDVKNQL